jgi:hypothetical protein|tara:strand:+ start:1119 stop:1379 length:261 start_codon:yes stop_codon:yes gene_type:complete
MIGDIVRFKDYCDEIYTAKVVDIFSEKFEDVKWLVLGDGEISRPHYYSKKTKSYRPVREKDMDSLYLEVESLRGKTDFILLKEIIN